MSLIYLTFTWRQVLKFVQIKQCYFCERDFKWSFQSLFWGDWGAGAPSIGAEIGTLRGSPECKHSFTRSWQPSFSMWMAILAMLWESSRPQCGRPSYCIPRFSSMQISFVWVRGTWKKPAWDSWISQNFFKCKNPKPTTYLKHQILSFKVSWFTSNYTFFHSDFSFCDFVRNHKEI